MDPCSDGSFGDVGVLGDLAQTQPLGPNLLASLLFHTGLSNHSPTRKPGTRFGVYFGTVLASWFDKLNFFSVKLLPHSFKFRERYQHHPTDHY